MPTAVKSGKIIELLLPRNSVGLKITDNKRKINNRKNILELGICFKFFHIFTTKKTKINKGKAELNIKYVPMPENISLLETVSTT